MRCPSVHLQYVANEQYRTLPGAQMRAGNLPRTIEQGVHTADDGVLSVMGPGAEKFRGFMDNTEVFRAIADALGLGRVASSVRSAPRQ